MNMLNDKVPPSRVTWHLRSVQIREWLASQRELASYFIIIVIENDRLMIHSADDGVWLGSINWADGIVTFIEAQNVGVSYTFRGLKSAFTFLDAFLLHGFAKMPQTPVKTAALAA